MTSETEQTKEPLVERTIQIELCITSGQKNYPLCEMIEQTLQNSCLNASEFKLTINHVKVV